VSGWSGQTDSAFTVGGLDAAAVMISPPRLDGGGHDLWSRAVRVGGGRPPCLVATEPV